MPDVPWVDGADVYFGDPQSPEPNWRADAERSEPPDDDREPTEDEIKAVAGMLGFDPRELDEAGE